MPTESKCTVRSRCLKVVSRCGLRKHRLGLHKPVLLIPLNGCFQSAFRTFPVARFGRSWKECLQRHSATSSTAFEAGTRA